MEDNKALGVWKWLVGLLIVCNMALIAIIWFKPVPQNGGRRGPEKRLMDFDKQLNLTKEQQDQFKIKIAEQHRKVDSLKVLAKAAREQFFANISTANPDTAQLQQLSAALGNYHRLVELQTFTSFRELRTLLTDEQKKTFDNLIQDVLKHLPEQPRVKGDGNNGPYPRGGETDGPPPSDGGDRQGPPDDGNGPPPNPRDGGPRR